MDTSPRTGGGEVKTFLHGDIKDNEGFMGQLKWGPINRYMESGLLGTVRSVVSRTPIKTIRWTLLVLAV